MKLKFSFWHQIEDLQHAWSICDEETRKNISTLQKENELLQEQLEKALRQNDNFQVELQNATLPWMKQMELLQEEGNLSRQTWADLEKQYVVSKKKEKYCIEYLFVYFFSTIILMAFLHFVDGTKNIQKCTS